MLSVFKNDSYNRHTLMYIYIYTASHIYTTDHSDNESENPLPPHELLFLISSKGSFYTHHPTYMIEHTTTSVTPVVEHWQ